MTNIIFSCEIGAREFLPRLWLAGELQKIGYNVIIGHKFTIYKLLKRQHGFIRGIFFYKDATTDSHKYMGQAKKLGLITVGLDEEFLNWLKPYDDNHYVSRSSADCVDYFFASNEATAQAAENAGLRTKKVGNLRLGACERIRLLKKHQPTKDVLINTAGGYLFNHYPLIKHLEIWSKLSQASWTVCYEKLKTFIDDEIKIVDAIKQLAESIKVGKSGLTIRTHPAESVLFWRQMFEDSFVSVEQGIDSSIISALNHKLVHGFDCTSLLESYVMGVPTVNHPVASGRTENTLARVFLDGAVDGYREGDARSKELEKFLYLGGIFSSWKNEIASLCPPSQQDPSIVPESSDRVEDMPADVLLRKGCLTRKSLDFLNSIDDLRGAKISFLSNDFFYFPSARQYSFGRE